MRKNFKPRKFDRKQESDRFSEGKSARNHSGQTTGVEPKFTTFKDMRVTYQPVTIYVNPKDGPVKSGQVYPIMTGKNKIIDSKYTGRVNYAGNQLRTMAARSETELNSIYDTIKVKTLTHLYLTSDVSDMNQVKADTIRGNMISSIANTMAQLYNETFRELDFFKLDIEGSNLSNNGKYFRILYNYQSVMQNLLSVINAYNRFIASEDILKQMSYGNESVKVNELYSLTRRNTLKGKVDALANFLLQEFID